MARGSKYKCESSYLIPAESANSTSCDESVFFFSILDKMLPQTYTASSSILGCISTVLGLLLDLEAEAWQNCLNTIWKEAVSAAVN